MDPRSEVILRQINYFKGTLLLAGLPADHLLDELAPRLTQVLAWSWQFDLHSHLATNYSAACHFSAEPPAQNVEQAIIFLPKSRELTEYLLQRVASRLSAPGHLFLVGEKKAGIERAAKQLASLGKTIKLDSARHCQLWHCQLAQAVADKPLALWAKNYQVSIAGVPGGLSIVSLPGVFSHGQLDQGTALLLQHLDTLPSGDLLDFGCGAGILGTALAKKYPHQTIHLLDVDAFALAATQMTLAANHINPARTRLIAGRGIMDAPTALAAIISNPPFHQGIHTSYQASEDLLNQAASHLQPHGELRLVANSFLKYLPLLERHFKQLSIAGKNNGFHVYQAKRH